MDELIKTVTEKAGINPEQAKNAVNTVMEFIKNKIPGIGEKLQGLFTAGGGAGDVVESVRKKLGI